MILDIAKLIITLIAWGVGYYIINLIVEAVDSIISVSGEAYAAVMFLWTIIPAIYFVARIRDLLKARKVIS